VKGRIRRKTRQDEKQRRGKKTRLGPENVKKRQIFNPTCEKLTKAKLTIMTGEKGSCVFTERKEGWGSRTSMITRGELNAGEKNRETKKQNFGIRKVKKKKRKGARRYGIKSGKSFSGINDEKKSRKKSLSARGENCNCERHPPFPMGKKKRKSQVGKES